MGLKALSHNKHDESGKAGIRAYAAEWWHHFKWHVYVWPATGFVAYLLNIFIVPLFSKPTHTGLGVYASTHPLRLAGGLLFLAFCGIAIQVWLKIRPILVREKQYAHMLDGIGLRELSYHDTDERRSSDWQRCVKEITDTRPNTLCILGATGWETFGSPQSPMHSLLREYQGRVHILLLKPSGNGFKRRTADLNKNEAAFKREIDDSISYCRDLVKNQNKSIEIKLYEDEPIWKMVFSDRYLWLQYYDPSKDVDKTPVYTLQTRDKPNATSLYYPLIRVFQRRWNDKTSTTITW